MPCMTIEDGSVGLCSARADSTLIVKSAQNRAIPRLVETVGDTFPLGILDEQANYEETQLQMEPGDKGGLLYRCGL